MPFQIFWASFLQWVQLSLLWNYQRRLYSFSNVWSHEVKDQIHLEISVRILWPIYRLASFVHNCLYLMYLTSWPTILMEATQLLHHPGLIEYGRCPRLSHPNEWRFLMRSLGEGMYDYKAVISYNLPLATYGWLWRGCVNYILQLNLKFWVVKLRIIWLELELSNHNTIC